jgi:hypothetical protein
MDRQAQPDGYIGFSACAWAIFILVQIRGTEVRVAPKV